MKLKTDRPLLTMFWPPAVLDVTDGEWAMFGEMDRISRLELENTSNLAVFDTMDRYRSIMSDLDNGVLSEEVQAGYEVWLEKNPMSATGYLTHPDQYIRKAYSAYVKQQERRSR